MHVVLTSEPRFQLGEHLDPLSGHRSSMALAAIRTSSHTVYRHQIAIEPAVPPAAPPSATSCIVRLPTPPTVRVAAIEAAGIRKPLQNRPYARLLITPFLTLKGARGSMPISCHSWHQRILKVIIAGCCV